MRILGTIIRTLIVDVLSRQAESSWDSEKGGWEPVGPSERKFVLGGLHWKQTGVYSLPSGGQKVYSSLNTCRAR